MKAAATTLLTVFFLATAAVAFAADSAPRPETTPASQAPSAELLDGEALGTPAAGCEADANALITTEEQRVESDGIETLEDPFKIEAGSCSPSCGSLQGQACTPGTWVRCYHTCYEPDVCTCPDGTWNCP